MTVCRALDCINNDRLTPPSCNRSGGPEIDERVICIHYVVDHDYRKIEDRERDQRKPWNEQNTGKICHD